MPNTILYIILLYVLPLYIVLFNCVSLSRSVRLVSFFIYVTDNISPICFIYVFVLIIDSDITSHRVVIGLFYHKISGSSFRKTSKVSMSLNDIIDFILNCMYVIIRKGMLLSRTNFVMMSNIMLMYLLLLFLAGDIEKNPGPMGTPVSENNNKSLTIFHSNIRSLRNKINYITDIIEDFDIVFFTETLRLFNTECKY